MVDIFLEPFRSETELLSPIVDVGNALCSEKPSLEYELLNFKAVVLSSSLKASQFLLDNILIATCRPGLFEKLDGAEKGLSGMNILDGCLLGCL